MSLKLDTNAHTARISAAILGATGVGLGAFGAHALKASLEQSQRLDTWETAVSYQMLHALALLALSVTKPQPRRALMLWWIGTGIFSGSLYLLCLTGFTWLGAITPLGGICLIAGWLSLLTVQPLKSID